MHTTAQLILDMQQNAETLTECFEALTNQRTYTTVTYLEIGARSFFQCATVFLPDYCSSAAEVTPEDLQESKVLCYEEYEADREDTQEKVYRFMQSTAVLSMTFD